MIRIGNAQAFWGDRPNAAQQLLAQVPDLDFLSMDYLAEVSMSILAMQRDRDPQLGYAQDFIDVVRGLADYWAAGGRCRLIVNAGGLNPLACAQACRAALEEQGCRPLVIGVVSGDDVLPALLARGQAADASGDTFSNLDSQAEIATVQDRLVTANAYLGCAGIVQALERGADLVITGRVADPSMVVAACVHAFGWKLDAWDALAGATVAGHLLECGTHVTGGIATDWLNVPDPVHLGFPIAEIDSRGECVITKPEQSGGMVTLETVKEQLVYEIGDPACYISPDVIVSFQGVQVESCGENRVRVWGARGSSRPSCFKVSATYRDGFRAAGMLTLFGPQSVRKAKRCGAIVLERLREAGCTYRDSIVECLGNAQSIAILGPKYGCEQTYETVLRMAVESESQADVESFSREFMPLVTAGPQGTSGYAQGRPRVHPVFRYWPCLIAATRASPQIDTFTTANTLADRASPPVWLREEIRKINAGTEAAWQDQPSLIPAVNPDQAVRLADLAYGRSGDKGTAANIGILIRSMEHYAWLVDWLTADRVWRFFDSIGVTAVQRYELPNLGGLNFVVQGILRRGIRNDSQGKSLAQALLSIPLSEVSEPTPDRRSPA